MCCAEFMSAKPEAVKVIVKSTYITVRNFCLPVHAEGFFGFAGVAVRAGAMGAAGAPRKLDVLLDPYAGCVVEAYAGCGAEA